MTERSLLNLQQALHYDETFNCVQCGYCLPACPTYDVLAKESASPRGRIALVKAAAEEKIDLLAHLNLPIDSCLGCRACEVACPTGVKYGTILEGAKNTIESQKPRSRSVKLLRRFIFKELFPHPKRMKAMTSLIWLYQKSGLQKAAHKTGITHKLPFHLGEFERALPGVSAPADFWQRKSVIKPEGEPKFKVAFFTGCIMDAVFFATNQKSIELLTAVGAEVMIPQTQTCCGALHSHSGEVDQAKELAKQNIEAFAATGADFYLNNAGGCGATLIEYDHLLAAEPDWVDRAQEFVRKTKDLNVFLAALESLPFKKEIPLRVTYQDSCHLRNVQKVVNQPRDLLRAIPGIEYVELPGADKCCGSAGVYNIVQYDTSMQVLDQKMESVETTQAAVVVTTNPGCLMQMRMGIQRENLEAQMQAVHIVDLLHEACGLSEK